MKILISIIIFCLLMTACGKKEKAVISEDEIISEINTQEFVRAVALNNTEKLKSYNINSLNEKTKKELEKSLAVAIDRMDSDNFRLLFSELRPEDTKHLKDRVKFRKKTIVSEILMENGFKVVDSSGNLISGNKGLLSNFVENREFTDKKELELLIVRFGFTKEKAVELTSIAIERYKRLDEIEKSINVQKNF